MKLKLKRMCWRQRKGGKKMKLIIPTYLQFLIAGDYLPWYLFHLMRLTPQI
uniref:Uncharacterized protein n=1 Tax=Picea sitchensis TaxID=3332 RepID=A9NN90_PICSI|nr:unknown [Picea sitchensis]